LGKKTLTALLYNIANNNNPNNSIINPYKNRNDNNIDWVHGDPGNEDCQNHSYDN